MRFQRYKILHFTKQYITYKIAQIFPYSDLETRERG